VTGSASCASMRWSISGRDEVAFFHRARGEPQAVEPPAQEPSWRGALGRVVLGRVSTWPTSPATASTRYAQAFPPIFSGLPIVSTGSVHLTELPARVPGLPPVGAEVAMSLPAQVSARARPALLSHCLRRPGSAGAPAPVPDVHEKVVEG
jgi:hypothetical protein